MDFPPGWLSYLFKIARTASLSLNCLDSMKVIVASGDSRTVACNRRGLGDRHAIRKQFHDDRMPKAMRVDFERETSSRSLYRAAAVRNAGRNLYTPRPAAKARGKALGGRRVFKARFAAIREAGLQANAAQAQKIRAEILPAIAKVKESGAVRSSPDRGRSECARGSDAARPWGVVGCTGAKSAERKCE